MGEHEIVQKVCIILQTIPDVSLVAVSHLTRPQSGETFEGMWVQFRLRGSGSARSDRPFTVIHDGEERLAAYMRSMYAAWQRIAPGTHLKAAGVTRAQVAFGAPVASADAADVGAVYIQTSEAMMASTASTTGGLSGLPASMVTGWIASSRKRADVAWPR
jgi:hypothetical protein